MTLPRFFSRVANALSPVLTDLSRSDIAGRLEQVVVSLEAPEDIERHQEHVLGLQLAANLYARLYPRIRLVAPKSVADGLADTIHGINPGCDISTGPGTSDATLAWGRFSTSEGAVIAGARGWNALIDDPVEALSPAVLPAILTAAALGVGEIFRVIFGNHLKFPRKSPSPGGFNLVTLGEPRDGLSGLDEPIDLGIVHLVGAGAIGQAAVYTLARVPTVSGILVVVEPQTVDLSNLQRYVLTRDGDENVSKCELVARELRETSLSVESVCAPWGHNDTERRRAEVVLVAVDTAEARIGIQASLPRAIYNAWTQPADLGWSRHENFGEEPCLACHYWSMGSRPNRHELIAMALRQDPLRVIVYLLHKIPVDLPLRPEHAQVNPAFLNHSDAPRWFKEPFLNDVAKELGISASDADQWKGRTVSDLYHDGICGGAIVTASHGDLQKDVIVPVAHQSALAGIMLATQLIVARSPQLRSLRAPLFEGRINILKGLSPSISSPRQRTPSCLCSDSDFKERYRERWGLGEV